MSIFYKAKHILVESLDEVDFIKEKIEIGESFEELAKNYSECDSAIKGGALGRFPQGTMVAEFERALYSMDNNEVRYGIKSKFGYHIILKEEA